MNNKIFCIMLTVIAKQSIAMDGIDCSPKVPRSPRRERQFTIIAQFPGDGAIGRLRNAIVVNDTDAINCLLSVEPTLIDEKLPIIHAIDTRGRTELTPLEYALVHEQTMCSTIAVLLVFKPKIDDCIIFDALEKGVKCVQLLLEAGACPQRAKIEGKMAFEVVNARKAQAEKRLKELQQISEKTGNSHHEDEAAVRALINKNADIMAVLQAKLA